MTAVSTLHKATANKTNNQNSKLIQKTHIWWLSRAGIINSKRLIRQAQCRSHRSSHQDPKNTKSKLAKNTPTHTATQACQDQWMAPTKYLEAMLIASTRKLRVATLIRSFVLTRKHRIKRIEVNNTCKVQINLWLFLQFKTKIQCKNTEPSILPTVDNCLTSSTKFKGFRWKTILLLRTKYHNPNPWISQWTMIGNQTWGKVAKTPADKTIKA